MLLLSEYYPMHKSGREDARGPAGPPGGNGGAAGPPGEDGALAGAAGEDSGPGGDEAAPSDDGGSAEVEMRSEFPETWLWMDEMTGYRKAALSLRDGHN